MLLLLSGTDGLGFVGGLWVVSGWFAGGVGCPRSDPVMPRAVFGWGRGC